MHARIEYYKDKQETAEFKLLKERIASEKAKENGSQSTVDFY
jgi:hypothetical protein